MTSAHEAPEDEVFLTPAQARRALGVSPRTLQRWYAAGKIREHHRLPNGHKRFARSAVEGLRGTEREDATP